MGFSQFSRLLPSSVWDSYVLRSLRHLVVRTVRRVANRLPDVPHLAEADRTHWVEAADGVRVFVYDLGPVDADVTVVFAHGFTLSSQSWVFQVDFLRRVFPGVRLLLPDHRGHGRSRADLEQVGVVRTSEDLVSVVRELAGSSRLMLVGHSMGTMSVLGALRLAGEDIRRRIQGIVLINGSIDNFSSEGITKLLNTPVVRVLRRLGSKLPAPLRSVEADLEWLLKPFIAAFVYHGALEDGLSAKFDVVEFHAEQIDDTSLSTVLGYLDDLAEHNESDAAPLLEGIPGAVLVGDMDDVTPAEQTRKIAEVWPGSTKIEFPDAGHMLPVESPEAVNAAIRDVLEPLV